MKFNLMTNNAITLKNCGQDLHTHEVTMQGGIRDKSGTQVPFR